MLQNEDEDDASDGCPDLNRASEGDIVKMLQLALEAGPPPPKWDPRSGKSEAESVRRREAGNAALKEGRAKRAMEEYNAAAISAPRDSEGNCLALALSNRSVFAMSNYNTRRKFAACKE